MFVTAQLYSDCRIATMTSGGVPYGLIDSGAIVAEAGKVLWVGPRADLPQQWRGLQAESLGGRLVTPALIDCHTHLVHAGNRARAFEMRLEGPHDEELARRSEARRVRKECVRT